MNEPFKLKVLTADTRVEDVEIPKVLTIGKEEVTLPDCVRNKDPHFLINSSGKTVKAAWISRALARLVAASNSEDKVEKQVKYADALNEVDTLVNELIKTKVLRNRRGPGAMAFAQAHEDVPEGSIMISKRSFELLKAANSKWAKVGNVIAIRFPNLGPGTTKRLKLVVNDELLSSSSIGSLCPQLLDLFRTPEVEDVSEVMDAFLLNPKDLKDGFEGDGDGRHNCRFWV